MERIYYKSATSVNPLSAAVRVGDTLYVSGQLGIDPATKKMAGEDAASQTRQAMINLRAVLENAGFTMDDVVKTMVYAADGADMPAINAEYGSAWGENKPARSAVLVAFPNKAAKFEVEAIAVKS